MVALKVALAAALAAAVVIGLLPACDPSDPEGDAGGALGLPLDGEVAWPLHTIARGHRGADGVDLADVNRDGLKDVTCGWEQSRLTTVSLHPGLEHVKEPWPTVEVGTGQLVEGVEDAKFADVDGDGAVDVISATESRRLLIHFAPSDPGAYLDAAAWSTVAVAAAEGRHNWMQTAFVDIDGDGREDIVAGGKGSPATVGWFKNPANPRDGAAWIYTVMSPAAWIMSVIPRDADGDGDQDVVVSDKTYISHPDGSRDFTLRGSRWLENREQGAVWVNHAISSEVGQNMFLSLTDLDGDGVEDVLDGYWVSTRSHASLRRNQGDWQGWTSYPIEQPAGVGSYQDVKAGDLDGDGVADLVFSYSHAEGDLSGVVWLKASGSPLDPVWQRGEVSGAPGTKYDNVELDDIDGDGDLDIVTSEQVEDLGVIWYENPTAP